MGFLDHHFFSVMMNSALKGFFGSSHGLRQCDPLSPFLFTLATDSFSASMSKVISLSFIHGFRVGGRRKFNFAISRLQFADDTIFFIKNSSDHGMHLKYILQTFETISGLKVNYTKSSMVGIGVEAMDLVNLAALLGCKVD